jgi:hypothetical protein
MVGMLSATQAPSSGLLAILIRRQTDGLASNSALRYYVARS